MKQVSRTSQVFAGTDGGVRLILIVLLVIVVAGLGAGLFLWVRKGQVDNAGLFTTKIKYPEVLLLEDFQRPMDRDLTEQLIAFERTGVSKFIDGNVLKPFFDDVNTRRLTLEGGELRPEQFPDRQDLQRIVDDCARILGIPKPRVFIRDTGEMNVYAANMAEPVIVVSSSFLRIFSDSAELRFVIGHEMGHIKCRHLKWKAVLNAVVESLRRLPAVPEEVSLLPYLPLFKWAREAEMSADNAGLICCQDLKAAERALVRLVLGLDDKTIGRINVDAFLKQRESENLSKFSEAIIYWRQLLKEQPFIADRILELRKYEQSRPYQHLWEGL
jgi:Zn-dependent protease with chaperone function